MKAGLEKELIARSIHNLSNRKDRPFVAVSCGAIPCDTLIESELFGTEKGGVQRGASSRQKRISGRGGAGTLFFDEESESLTPRRRWKMLRVLQEREFSRLGSSQPIRLQARLLFATHRNLLEMVESGTFRQDLYYRVNVMGIKSPALRDHTEDIPLLALHFLEQYSQLYRRSGMTISANSMALLCWSIRGLATSGNWKT